MSEERSEAIDSSWWTNALDSASDANGSVTMELLSPSFEALLKGSALGGLQRRVVEALSIATSAMLVPDNWLEPYEPAMQLAGRRTSIPSDLNREQLTLLAQLAPLIVQPILRARVADIAWFYGDRGNVQLLELAIDAYRAIPLDRHTWATVGRGSWRRATELAHRRGKAGIPQLAEIGEALRKRVLATQVAEGFMTAELSALLRGSLRPEAEAAHGLGEHCAELASLARADNPRLSRHLEREALAWFGRCSDATATCRCTAHIADTYVAEADRLAGGPSTAMAVGRLLEKAIATIRTLPVSTALPIISTVTSLSYARDLLTAADQHSIR